MRQIAIASIFGLALLCAYPSLGDESSSPSGQIPFDSTWTTADGTPTRGELFTTLEDLRKSEPEARAPEHVNSFAFVLKFLFPTDVVTDRVNHVPRTNVHFGIDLDYGNSPDIDFDSLHDQGVEFVYARATYGSKRYDSKFGKFWPKLSTIKTGSHGPVYRGAYHFLLPGSPDVQANTFISFVKQVDPDGIKADDLPPGVDLEWTTSNPANDAWKGHDPDEIVDTALAVMKKFDAEWHRSAVLYTNAGWWNERTAGHPEKAKALKRITDAGFTLWISDYRGSDLLKEVPKTPASMPWTIWQFTANSELDHGYPTKKDCYAADGKPKLECIDASVFKGTSDEFKRAFGLK